MPSAPRSQTSCPAWRPSRAPYSRAWACPADPACPHPALRAAKASARAAASVGFRRPQAKLLARPACSVRLLLLLRSRLQLVLVLHPVATLRWCLLAALPLLWPPLAAPPDLAAQAHQVRRQQLHPPPRRCLPLTLALLQPLQPSSSSFRSRGRDRGSRCTARARAPAAAQAAALAAGVGEAAMTAAASTMVTMTTTTAAGEQARAPLVAAGRAATGTAAQVAQAQAQALARALPPKHLRSRGRPSSRKPSLRPPQRLARALAPAAASAAPQAGTSLPPPLRTVARPGLPRHRPPAVLAAARAAFRLLSLPLALALARARAT